MLRFADFVMAGNDTLAPNGENLLLTNPHADTAYFNDEVLQYGYGVFLWDRYPATIDEWKEAHLLDDLEVSYSNTLTPLDATRFLWDVQNTTIAVDFVPGPTGRAHFFRHRAFVAERNNDRSANGPVVSRARVEAWLYSLETRHDVSMRSFFPPHSL